MHVGDMAYLPVQVDEDHPAYQLAVIITRDPGPIVSIVDDWATVDRGRFGQFGCAVEDLTLAPKMP